MIPQDGDPGPGDDPRPMPPVRPSIEDCCRGSCDPCIFDVHDAALDRYRSELQAWEERQANARRRGWSKPLP